MISTSFRCLNPSDPIYLKHFAKREVPAVRERLLLLTKLDMPLQIQVGDCGLKGAYFCVPPETSNTIYIHEDLALGAQDLSNPFGNDGLVTYGPELVEKLRQFAVQHIDGPLVQRWKYETLPFTVQQKGAHRNAETMASFISACFKHHNGIYVPPPEDSAPFYPETDLSDYPKPPQSAPSTPVIGGKMPRPPFPPLPPLPPKRLSLDGSSASAK